MVHDNILWLVWFILFMLLCHTKVLKSTIILIYTTVISFYSSCSFNVFKLELDDLTGWTVNLYKLRFRQFGHSFLLVRAAVYSSWTMILRSCQFHILFGFLKHWFNHQINSELTFLPCMYLRFGFSSSWWNTSSITT